MCLYYYWLDFTESECDLIIYARVAQDEYGRCLHFKHLFSKKKSVLHSNFITVLDSRLWSSVFNHFLQVRNLTKLCDTIIL